MSVPAAYLGIVIIWSTTPLAVQWSAEGVGFMFGITLRMGAGALLSLLLLTALRVRLPWKADSLRGYAAAALGLYGGMTGVYWSAQYVPSGLISVMFGLTPLLAGLFSLLWLGERGLTPARLAGMLISLGGLLVIFQADYSAYPQAWKGIAMLLLSVTVYAASMVLVKRSGAELHPLAMSTGSLLLATPCYLLTWLLLDGIAWPATVPARTLLSIGYLAVFGSLIGFLLYFYALKHLSTAVMALVSLITPVLALQLGRLANHESVPAKVWAGTAVVLAGLALHQWGGRIRLRRRQKVLAA